MRTVFLFQLVIATSALAAPLPSGNTLEARQDNSNNVNRTLDSSSSTLSNGLTITSNETVGDLLISLGVALTSPATDLISALGSNFTINEVASSVQSANAGANNVPSSVTIGLNVDGGDIANAGTRNGDRVNDGVAQGNQRTVGNLIQGSKIDNSTITGDHDSSPGVNGGNGGTVIGEGNSNGGDVTVTAVGGSVKTENNTGGTTIGNQISGGSFDGSTIKATNDIKTEDTTGGTTIGNDISGGSFNGSTINASNRVR